MTFQNDLSFGKRYEQLASTMVSNFKEFAPNGLFKGWDFCSDTSKYEVKADRLAYKYGCRTMFIEYECSGKPSGISTTEADYWFYFMVLPDGSSRRFLIPTSMLKKACNGCITKVGGDGWRSKGYIVPTDAFEAFASSEPAPLGVTPLRV